VKRALVLLAALWLLSAMVSCGLKIHNSQSIEFPRWREPPQNQGD